MNIYDFDNTIYYGDTNKDLIKYAFKKHPIIVLKSLLKAKKLRKDYKNGLIPFERVKEAMLSFIFQINNYPKFIHDFVDTHMKNIKPWYISKKTENDIIVSASYDLWVSLFARKLGVKMVIATKVDTHGQIIGKNCKGEEKVRRIKEFAREVPILTSYSDSQSDIPVLEIANNAFVVEGNKICTYFKGYKFKN